MFLFVVHSQRPSIPASEGYPAMYRRRLGMIGPPPMSLGRAEQKCPKVPHLTCILTLISTSAVALRLLEPLPSAAIFCRAPF